MSQSNERAKRRSQPEMRGFPTGVDILRDPALNKGTAFTREERELLGLTGLLPPQILSQETQMQRALENIRKKPTDLERYIYLANMLDRNETLFYRMLIDNIDELMPIVYTPTVGQACQQYGLIFQVTRGLYVSYNEHGRIADVLRNWPYENIQVVVVTDGERILGLGDLGAYGMGIPVGKLSLYTACAGIYPNQCLPVVLDVGTNNETLLGDPLYLGLKQHRLRGSAYDSLVDEFVQAVQEVFPNALIQFEDFANSNAFRLLQKYRNRVCMFNDDIQGTGSVVLAGLFAAARITKRPLQEQRILFMGAGEAGLGIAGMITAALVDAGMSKSDARKHCWFVDSKGLLVKSRADLTEHKQEYAHEHEAQKDFLAAVKALKPHAIIGVCGRSGAFNKEIVEAMAGLNEYPVIFALSNPTSKAECTAAQAYEWSGGRAVFASGSPFKPVEYNGRRYVPGQGNNAYIFPGVGLGVTAAQAKTVTDEMFEVAAKTLSEQVTETELEQGLIYPPLSKIREASMAIAEAVMELAYERDLARHAKPADLRAYLESHVYNPVYHGYV